MEESRCWNFDLLRQLVLFAEELSSQCGMEQTFVLTTNGTLLNDEAIHFLVEHNFVVTISLDGPKEVHDRYRVFRSEEYPERRCGSYDIVMNNIQRFVKLYPEYRRRGLAVTVTGQLKIAEINALLKELTVSFPGIRITFVWGAVR